MEELEKKMEVELVARRRLQASWATATCFNFAEFPFMVPLVRQNAFCACEKGAVVVAAVSPAFTQA